MEVRRLPGQPDSPEHKHDRALGDDISQPEEVVAPPSEAVIVDENSLETKTIEALKKVCEEFETNVCVRHHFKVNSLRKYIDDHKDTFDKTIYAGLIDMREYLIIRRLYLILLNEKQSQADRIEVLKKTILENRKLLSSAFRQKIVAAVKETGWVRSSQLDSPRLNALSLPSTPRSTPGSGRSSPAPSPRSISCERRSTSPRLEFKQSFPVQPSSRAKPQVDEPQRRANIITIKKLEEKYEKKLKADKLQELRSAKSIAEKVLIYNGTKKIEGAKFMHLIQKVPLRYILPSANSLVSMGIADKKSVEDFKREFLQFEFDNIANIPEWQAQGIHQFVEEKAVRISENDQTAKNVLMGLYQVILSHQWQLGWFGGETIGNGKGQFNKVPKNMAKIFETISQTLKDGNWHATLGEVHSILDGAVKNKSHSFFNKRDPLTSEFYKVAKAKLEMTAGKIAYKQHPFFR